MQSYESRQKDYASMGQKHFYFMTLNGNEVNVYTSAGCACNNCIYVASCNNFVSSFVNAGN